MSHSQFHFTGRVYLNLHGLIFETSICYWQDQPGRLTLTQDKRGVQRAAAAEPGLGPGRAGQGETQSAPWAGEYDRGGPEKAVFAGSTLRQGRPLCGARGARRAPSDDIRERRGVSGSLRTFGGHRGTGGGGGVGAPTEDASYRAPQSKGLPGGKNRPPKHQPRGWAAEAFPGQVAVASRSALWKPGEGERGRCKRPPRLTSTEDWEDKRHQPQKGLLPFGKDFVSFAVVLRFSKTGFL